jgi:thioredoxin 2
MARLAKVNTEEETELSNQYGIRSIPTIIIFKGGREISRQPGAMDLSALVDWVKANS